jgi:hypothetical protein
MKKHNDDDLFTDEDDPIWNEPAAKPKAKKLERIRRDFYLCSTAWADEAAEVAGMYLILAFRLYRRWRMREPGADTIAVTAKAMAGPGYSRTGRRRLIARLEEAGLVEVVARAPGRAAQVRVIEPKPRST